MFDPNMLRQQSLQLYGETLRLASVAMEDNEKLDEMGIEAVMVELWAMLGEEMIMFFRMFDRSRQKSVLKDAMIELFKNTKKEGE